MVVAEIETSGPVAARGRGLVERACELNAAVSDHTRMKMIKVLGSHPRGSLTVSDVARILRVSQPAATKQLQVLHRAGLVDWKRSGQAVYYSINEDTIAEYHRIMEYAFAHAATPCVNDYDCDTCPYRETCV